MEEEKHIAFEADLNECVAEGDFVNKMQSIGLKEAITLKHKEEQELDNNLD